MPIILLLLYPVLEIYLLVKGIEIYSFGDILLFMISTGFLGILIMTLQGRAVFSALQHSFGQNQVPGNLVLHRALVFLGGLLIMLPGVLTDLIGVALVLPGLRHLLVLYLRVKITKGLSNGSVRIFSSGFGAFARGPQTGATGGGFSAPKERDAQVIEVDVLESSSSRIE